MKPPTLKISSVCENRWQIASPRSSTYLRAAEKESERLCVQAMTRMLIQVRLAGTARFHPAPFPIFCAKPDVQRGQN